MTNQFLYSSLLLLVGTLALGQPTPLVGNDQDPHGCIGSAGYTFSVLKNDCIRVFEQKIILIEAHHTGSSTSMAAVIFSKNNKKAEVFIPGSSSGILMSRQGKAGGYHWKKGNLSLWPGKAYVLKRGNVVLFGSPE